MAKVKVHKIKISEVFIARALAVRHPVAKGWVYLPGLRTKSGFADSTGYLSTPCQMRTLDAFAIHTWPSQKFCRVGYEIKSDRGDFLRELKDPNKHMQGYFLCHEFWFAMAEGIFRRDEDDLTNIGGCGILEVSQDGAIKPLVAPTHHEPLGTPETFLASLLSAAVRASDRYAEELAKLDVSLALPPMPEPVPVANSGTPQTPIGLWERKEA